MSILDLNLENTPEETALEDGEYKVRVNKAEQRESSKTPGNFGILLFLEFPDEPDASNAVSWLGLPLSTDDEKTANRKRRQIKQACEAFDVDFGDNPDPDTLAERFVNQTAYADVTQQEDPDYGVTNNIRRFIPQR